MDIKIIRNLRRIIVTIIKNATNGLNSRLTQIENSTEKLTQAQFKDTNKM